jgi:enamine deaminase RidA (YjgF/YER057c/UK114 family)
LNKIEENLIKLNIELPKAAAPVASYAPFSFSENLLFISGQGPFGKNGLIKGKIGKDLNIEEGQEAARLCALMVLAQLKKACGGFEKIVKCLKIGGFVNATEDFVDHAIVLDGASKILIEILEDRGWHARYAVGSSSLPLNMAVEIDAIFEIKK